ncbi:hypothetical protein ACPW96_19200 [Micromonospora sp. DT81.3]|uniref:hypothetical protein n=1 Tax=Micromonospora sp. DT81.3 TaxID=3416523 RepID=UPI003CEEF9DF
MWFWVTRDADIRCEHKLGRVDLKAPEDFVFVSGQPVLTDGDPIGRSIGGCPNLSIGIKPCTVTVNVQRGHSGYVTIAGKPIVRADLAGLTDGTPQGQVQYRVQHPGQTLVTEAP